jgi:hypothetical protein
MCCYGCFMRSFYEMYKMALTLAASLSQMNPVNTSAPIALRSLLMLLYRKFQGHPMSTVAGDFRRKKMYAFVFLILACCMYRLCYPSGYYHPNNTCGESTNRDVSYYVNLFLFILGLLSLSLVKILLQHFFGINLNLYFSPVFYIYLEKTSKSVYLMYLVFRGGR